MVKIMTKREARAMVTRLGTRTKLISQRSAMSEAIDKEVKSVDQELDANLTAVRLLEQSIEKQKIHAPQIGYGLHGQRKSAKS
jgi:hypothetical protein